MLLLSGASSPGPSPSGRGREWRGIVTRSKWERLDDGDLTQDVDDCEIFVTHLIGGFSYRIYKDGAVQPISGDGYKTEAGAKAAALRRVRGIVQ